MLTNLFGEDIPEQPSRQKARPEKSEPVRRKKKTDAPEPNPNRFTGRSSKKTEISVTPQAVEEPVDNSSNEAEISAEQRMTPSKNTRISASPALDNSAGNLIRAVDTFRMFGMVDE